MTSTETKNAQIALNSRHASAGTWRNVADAIYEASGLRFSHAYLLLVAAGNRRPNRKLVRALNAITPDPTDRVRFAVWLTRAERDELNEEIVRAGTCRHEWLMDLARDVKEF